MRSISYGKPLLIQNEKVEKLSRTEAFNEEYIQNLIFDHPDCLPIAEIDEAFYPALSVCKELNTPVGPLDILMVTPTGRLIIVETKLWRNPEARRKVIAQIMDYAREMTKWSYEDLQREINKNLKRKGNTLYELACGTDSEIGIGEAAFVDSVSRNLKKGNFLLLIAGDGIREGASNITEFLTNAGHLDFTFAMVELSIYEHPEIGQVILPRINVKTVELERIVFDLPDGISVAQTNTSDKLVPKDKSLTPEQVKEKEFYQTFWQELVTELEFDDQGQPLPSPANWTNLYVYLPDKNGWISAYFMKSDNRVGVYFRYGKTEKGREIGAYMQEHKDEIIQELGSDVIWDMNTDGGGAGVRLKVNDVFADTSRKQIKEFFKYQLNNFVNVFRPRIKHLEDQ